MLEASMWFDVPELHRSAKMRVMHANFLWKICWWNQWRCMILPLDWKHDDTPWHYTTDVILQRRRPRREQLQSHAVSLTPASLPWHRRTIKSGLILASYCHAKLAFHGDIISLKQLTYGEHTSEWNCHYLMPLFDWRTMTYLQVVAFIWKLPSIVADRKLNHFTPIARTESMSFDFADLKYLTTMSSRRGQLRLKTCDAAWGSGLMLSHTYPVVDSHSSYLSNTIDLTTGRSGWRVNSWYE